MNAEITPGDQAGLDQLKAALESLVAEMGLELVGWPRLGDQPTLASLAIPAAEALASGALLVIAPVALPSGVAITAAVVGRPDAVQS